MVVTTASVTLAIFLATVRRFIYLLKASIPYLLLLLPHGDTAAFYGDSL